jgi:hypothetical protein
MPGCPYWIGIVFFAWGVALADPLYRWVDAEGKVHYSDHQPSDHAKVLHPETGHEPTPKEREASNIKKLEKEIEKLKQEAGKTKETPQQPVVIIPVPIVQPQPKLYTPYWGPIYPYRSRQFYRGSKPDLVHPHLDSRSNRIQKKPESRPLPQQNPRH